VRGSEEEVIKAIQNLCDGSETWEDVSKRLKPVQSIVETAE
jgi:hypothetical protein